MRAIRWLALAIALLAVGCGGDDDGDGGDPADAAPATDAAPPDAPVGDASFMPQTLAETGLYADPEAEILAPGVREYRPEYELWSDGAVKRRFVLLPDSGVIDTADMDFWQYPIGTKLWKEFVRDGVRVETRLLYKTAPGAWFMMAYAWNAAQTEAVATPAGAADVLGTGHDIPRANDCGKCHERTPDFVLGFSAIQLDHDLDGVTLADLVAEERLSAPPAGAPPYFDVPGAGTEAQPALGYLHANCGGCHNPHSDVMDTVLVDLRLAVADLGAVQDTTAFRTAVGVPNMRGAGQPVTAIIEPGDPDQSALFVRMNSRELDVGMPPLATELLDTDGIDAVGAWILSLAP